MVDRFRSFVESQHLVPHGSKVLLAVSGGRDSVCMAHLFFRAGIPFAIAHCNFNLRPGDCDRDQAFVSQLAADYGVDFHTTAFDTRRYAAEHHLGIEDAARRLRYDYFFDLLREHGYSVVATAHHRDDSIETFFLNLFRGTGIAGLHGIRPLTTPCPPFTVIRPLLCFSRHDIDTYVATHGLAYVEDYTNALLDARRNRIRHRLMPLLRELYPSVDSTIEADIERLRMVEEVYDAAVADLVARLENHESSPFGIDYSYYNVADLLELDPRRPYLFALLRRYCFTPSAVDDIIATLEHGQTGTRFFSPTHMALLDRDRLLLAEYFFLPPAPTVEVAPVAGDALPDHLEVAHKGNLVEYVDADLVRQPLIVRHWRPGDRFYPLGMSHQRSLSDFLKDCKINRFEKYCVHVLVDADDRIVWVVGLRLDNRFRITSATRSALRLSADVARCSS